MSKGDMAKRARRDIAAAFALLTRLPVPYPDGVARPAQAAWAYPVAGAGVAVVAAAAACDALWLGLGPVIAALIAVAAQVFVCGAMHEDGLADSADGLWGGWTPERRLEIMKDSQIGSYGVLALVFVVLLRVAALALIFAQGSVLGALVLAAMASRVPMVWIMSALPHARSTGLSHATGRADGSAAWIGAAMALIVALWVAPGAIPLALVLLAAASWWIARLAQAKINGQTGDILGATQQISEVLVLLALVAAL